MEPQGSKYELCSATKEKTDMDLRMAGDVVDCKPVMETQRARAGAALGLHNPAKPPGLSSCFCLDT